MKVYALFCKRNALGSKILQWAEGIEFSHCAIAIEDQHGNTDVYESVWPKSRMMPLAEWEKHYEIVECYGFAVEDNVKFMEMKFFLKTKLRLWYSLAQIIIMGIGILCSPLAGHLPKRINGSRALVCTEMQGDFFINFYGASWNESTDTISLRETRDEIKKLWSNQYADISNT